MERLDGLDAGDAVTDFLRRHGNVLLRVETSLFAAEEFRLAND